MDKMMAGQKEMDEFFEIKDYVRTAPRIDRYKLELMLAEYWKTKEAYIDIAIKEAMGISY